MSDRLLPIVPALLFGVAAVAISIRWWTKVWVPRSVPAMHWFGVAFVAADALCLGVLCWVCLLAYRRGTAGLAVLSALLGMGFLFGSLLYYFTPVFGSPVHLATAVIGSIAGIWVRRGRNQALVHARGSGIMA